MTDRQSWFGKWFDSSYYFDLYFKRGRGEAAAFIDRLIGFLQPEPDSFMFDIGCGRGRHSVYLASLGFDVTGIDLPEDNIARAKKKEHAHLHFFCHDMRLPFWINYFDYAFNFFTSFGYFNTRREHDNAIRTAAQSLKSCAVLVIDYLNVHYEEGHLAPDPNRGIGKVNYAIAKWFDNTLFYKKIVVEDERPEMSWSFLKKCPSSDRATL